MDADSSTLLDWYGKLPARRVDLVGDYAGQELFIVEGDGLLLRCFDDPKLDFTGKCLFFFCNTFASFKPSHYFGPLTDWLDGFQLLHAVYAVEHFLQALLQRKCVFHLVFFGTHKELCIPRATPSQSRNKYLLARAIILRHLEVHLYLSHPTVKIYTFDSVLDPAFQDYLNAAGAYFIMTHDGANPLPLSKDSRLKHHNLDVQSIESEEHRRRVMFRSSIFAVIDQGYNIALIDGLELMDTKVSDFR